ncbi:Apolipoprotein N-acyltransferase [Planctomycetes bacterium CA13]|uniref:Apolipoprotein N-acyltransferase n=1 Tax=Novipirellula herctigrandis TaxID=2527986 RepID=A0A5C5Z536_9BACT|nr:Apolipoprotein N-acyltransferase [Planctomycetes bacterium CA13]
MNSNHNYFDTSTEYGRYFLVCLACLLLWASQPPWGLWPLSIVALVPLLRLVESPCGFSRRDYLGFGLVAVVYWLVTLQGIRHAHPAMYVCLFVLASYFGVYIPLFIGLGRHLRKRNWPLVLVAPVVWVGLECWRNYIATGISAAMLGHTWADVSIMIQIADLFGSYGVSFLIVIINVALYALLARFCWNSSGKKVGVSVSLSVAAILVVATFFYGQYRLGQSLGEELCTFALIQRNEQVEYQQEAGRADEIFGAYARQSITALESSPEPVGAVVWPESMFTGGLPYMLADVNAVAPPEYPGDASEFPMVVDENRQAFLSRAGDVLRVLESVNPNGAMPHLVVGCGVVHYSDVPRIYSGVVQIAPDQTVPNWYGKNHLVMFGEYIPIIRSIPGLRSFVPDGLMVTPGAGPQVLKIDDTQVLPSICIETAVERVTINHLSKLVSQKSGADVIVTVTNDGWFDDSSIIDHHLRCARFVAVGGRRPILSSANNGPTAWIDSCGRIVGASPVGTDGAVIATPRRDDRTSLYVRIGDFPAKVLAMICLVAVMDWWIRRNRDRKFASKQAVLDESK